MTNHDARLFELQAQLIAMFAHPKRLMIMELLNEGEKSVGELAEALSIPIQNVSQHLRAMRDRDVVMARKSGQTVYYSITNPKYPECCRLVRQAIAEELRKKGDTVALGEESGPGE